MNCSYRYNENTHTLHIYGYCYNSTNPKCLEFETEDDVLKYDGRAVSMCKICQKKRDKEVNGK